MSIYDHRDAIHKEGEDAFHRGETLDQNPYERRTDDCRNWARGWLDADDLDNFHTILDRKL